MEKTNWEELNAELQKELTVDNEQFYVNLLIYVRAKTMIRDHEKAEELLLEILQDILEAQEQGISAEEYFGKNPKQIADEMIANLPINVWDAVKLGLVAITSYLVVTFFPTMVFPDKAIDLGKLLIGGLAATVFAILAMKLLGYSAYRYQSKFWRLVPYLFVAVGLIGCIALLDFISTPLTISISPTIGILLILLMSAIVAGLFYKEKDKDLWLPFIPPLTCNAIGGIIFRLDAFSGLLNSKRGALIIAGCLIAAMIAQYVIIFVVYRRQKNRSLKS
ncbi:hypothetical protein [Enterococcus sp. AZ109]|uniref:hypothetical protein n=1 Tax=Enterococcus sp. AZ109 TaxID=2774634 RepID=UPI003F1F8605